MKKLLVACSVVLIFAFNSFAKLAFVSLDEAVKNSDLIIVGTLREISEKSDEGTIYGKGEIVVEQFIAGNVKTANGFLLKSGDKLPFNYVENFACVYGSHKGIENEKGIFLLTLDDNGEIESEDFRSLGDLPEIKKLLKKGIKPRELAKTVKTQNGIEQKTQTLIIEKPNHQTSEASFCMYSNKAKTTKYYPLTAFLVILFSGSLYYLLYRSRFKIR